jgi:TPR repeat protein
MKKPLITALLALALAITSPANAGLDEGIAALEAGNYAVALREFQALAKKENPYAQLMLGMMYAEGKGVAQDDTEAVNWIRKAAMQGDVDAQYRLGAMYFNGLGVIQDHKEAVNWFRKAARQGDVSAQYNLSFMYAQGQGVAKNYVIAYALFNTASVTDSEAHKGRSELTKMMTPAQIKAGQALAQRMQAVGIDKALK